MPPTPRNTAGTRFLSYILREPSVPQVLVLGDVRVVTAAFALARGGDAPAS